MWRSINRMRDRLSSEPNVPFRGSVENGHDLVALLVLVVVGEAGGEVDREADLADAAN
jgi:hypothetical protein